MNKFSIISKRSNNLYENKILVLCEIMHRSLKIVCFHKKYLQATSCGTFADGSKYKNHNKK